MAVDAFAILLIRVAILIVLLPVGVAALRWRRLTPAQRFLGRLLVVIAAISLEAGVLGVFYQRNNHPLYQVYILVEGVGLWWLYGYRFPAWRRDRWLRWLVAGYVLFVMANAVFGQGIWVLPTYSRSLESLLIIALAIRVLIQEMRQLQEPRLERSFWFWLTAGLFIYFTSNFILFVFSNVLIKEGARPFNSLWAVHALLNIGLYLAYSAALLGHDHHAAAHAGVEEKPLK